MTQTDRVLGLLRSAGTRGITPLDAQAEIGTMRLAAQVWELRQRGYNISTTHEKHRGGTHARYVLHVPPPSPVRYVACPSCGGHLLPAVPEGRICENCKHRVVP